MPPPSPTDDLIVSVPPLVTIVSDPAGLQVIGVEGQTIDFIADETVVTITPEIVEIEAPDISMTSEAAIEIVATDLNVTPGAMEVETGDVSLSAGAVEVETGMFTVL